MDPHERQSESKAKFRQSDLLFRQGKSREAMQLLVELDRAYPNTKNILYPMAMCLERLGCSGEAEQVCDRLIEQHQYKKAVELKAAIQAKRAAQSQQTVDLLTIDPNVNVVDDILGPAESAFGRRAPVAVKEEPATWKKYLLIGGGVALAVLILVVVPVIGHMNYTPPSPTPAPTAAPTAVSQALILPGGFPSPDGLALLLGAGMGVMVFVLILMFLFLFSVNILSSYVALAIMGNLGGDVLADVKYIAVTLAIAYLYSLIPIIGPFLGMWYIMKRFQLGCFGVLLYAAATGVINIGLMYVLFFILATVFH